MADDFMDEKVGVAVAASAVVFSPKVRSLLHRGAVLGVSGVLAATDMVFGFVRGLSSGLSNGAGGDGARTNGRGARKQDEEQDEAPATPRRRRTAGAAVS